MRRQISTKLGMWIEHVWAHLDFLCPTSSFGARGLRKFEGKMTHRNFVPTDLSFMNQTAPNFNMLRIAQRYTDCKRHKQKHPFFLSRHRAAADLHQTWHVDRACPCHVWAHLDFLCPTSSFGARGLRKFWGKMAHRNFVPTNLSFMNQTEPNFNMLHRQAMHI